MSSIKGAMLVGIITLTCVVSGLFLADNVNAGDGTGSTGSGTNKDVCHGGGRYTTSVCTSGKGKGRGGASWHLFKTTKSVTKDKVYKSGITFDKDLPALNKGGYDRKMSISCPISKYNYVLVYVWDGWASGNDNWTPVYWGPFAVGGKISTSDGKYAPHLNTNGAKSWDTVQDGYYNGTNMNKWRVTGKRDGGVALAFWRRHKAQAAGYTPDQFDDVKTKWNQIPSSTGYMCITMPVNLTAVARDTSGRILEDKIDKDKVWSGKKAKVSIKEQKYDDLKFLGWSKKSSGSSVISTENEYSELIKNNTTVYAVYSGTTVTDDEGCNEEVHAISKYQGDTYTTSRVKNASLTNENGDWSEAVYAKPTDNINWLHCYYPGVQVTADTPVTTNHYHDRTHDSEWSENCDSWSSNCNAYPDYSYSLTEQPIKNVIPWGNSYFVSRDFAPGLFDGYAAFSIGDTTKRQYRDNSYSVDIGKEGKELKETITSSSPTSVSITDMGSHFWDCKWEYKGYEDAETTNTCDKWSEPDGNGNKTCEKYHVIYHKHYDWSDTCSHTEKYWKKSVDEGEGPYPASSSAKVMVPFNFLNRTSITSSEDTDDIVFAGETKTIRMEIATLPKENNVTQDSYTTKVPRAQWKLKVCYGTNIEGSGDESDSGPSVVEDGDVGGDDEGDGEFELGSDEMIDDESFEGYDRFSEYDGDEGLNSYSDEGVCVESDSFSGTLNGNSNMQGDITTKDIRINVPDIVAGSDVCIRSAVYPSNSGADDNYTNENGNGEWAYSQDKICYTVGKKPSMQVWGGNVFSKGSISTATSNKGHLDGYNTYNPSTNYSRHIFGSWNELGVISTGLIKGFGSGSALGYQSNDGGAVWPKFHPEDGRGNNASIIGQPGGSTSISFCVHSPLTFANSGCNFGTAGLIGTATGTNKANDDKQRVINRLIPENKPSSVTEVDFNNNESYYYRNGSLVLNEANLGVAGAIKVVHATGNIEVDGDIVYGNDGYTTIFEVPKLVIYAEENVEIDCNVKRIDALIMAGKQVQTCADSDDVNNQNNSNQLVVNGAIIANTMSAKRTYGASSGANSIIPAEIVNFDPTLYMWAGSNDQSDTVSGGLNATYTVEVSPRL